VTSVAAVAFDKAGNYIVSGVVDGRPGVAAFDRRATGTTSPLWTISGDQSGLVSPYYLAVDGRDRVYVLNDQNGDRSLSVFTAGEHGDVAPMAQFHEAELPVKNPRDIAYDRKSDGVIILGSQVSAWIPGGISSRALPASRRLKLYGDSISPGADGWMGVSRGDGSFEAFTLAANGRMAQRHVLAVDNAELGNPSFVSVARDGSIYFASADGSVERFAANARGDARPLSTLRVEQLYRSGGGSTVSGFAGDTAGTLYFSRTDRDAVEIIEADGHERMLEGDQTGLKAPPGIAVDASGALYVTNLGNNAVTVYSPGASGNVRPTRTLSGEVTGLKGPQAIAADEDGTLYVFYGPEELDSLSSPEQYVAAFPAGARGDTPPRRRYVVHSGCFTNDHI